GYDKNTGNVVRNQSERFTLNARNTYTMFDNKLFLEAGVLMSGSIRKNSPVPHYPTMYSKLADQQGNEGSVGGGWTSAGFRQSYIDTAGNGLLKDWNYRPLEEIYLVDNTATTMNYQMRSALSYRPFDWVSMTLRYQYEHGNGKVEDYVDPTSF